MIYRQGDVLISIAASMPQGLKPIAPSARGYVIAEGEATGHAHVATGTEIHLYEDEHGTLWLRVGGDGGSVIHEEHETVALPVGDYHITHQREWTDDDEPRRVID